MRLNRRGFLGAAVGALAALVTLAPVSAAQALVLAQAEPTTLQLWTAALAILTTIISSLLLSFPEHWGPWVKRGAVAIIAGVLSAAGLWYEGRLDLGDLGRVWLLVFIGASGFYTVLYRPVSDALKGNLQT